MNKPIAIILSAIAFLFAGISLWRAHQDADSALPPHSEVAEPADSGERRRKADFWQAYRNATAHRMAGRYVEAAAMYERALSLEPDHQDALYYLGNVLADLHKYEGARASWDRLVAVNPNSARGHARLGDLFFCVGTGYEVDLDRARASYHEAHKINKEETGHLLRLGELALADEKWSTAKRHFEDVLASNTSSREVPFFLAYLERTAGRIENAIQLLEHARGIQQPDTPDGMTGEGDTRGKDPQFERAGCSDLDEIISGFDLVEPEQLRSNAERRFRRLDQWLASRRGLSSRYTPADAAEQE